MAPTSTDWRLPANRREAFQRFYTFHLKYRSHPGCVYSLLPAIADHYGLDADGRAWLVWLNGNTQNVVTSLLLGEESEWDPNAWERAVSLWNERFKDLEWDTDRRHQKSKFGGATEAWFRGYMFGDHGGDQWRSAGALGWRATWDYAYAQPYMGRLSTWSMIEYARILFGPAVPDADSWLLNDVSGSQSHRNGLAVVKGHDAAHWEKDAAKTLGIVEELAEFGDELLAEAEHRNAELDLEASHTEGVAMYAIHPDVGRLTMESALCTYKGWHKPNRRYPNVYVDMMHGRITRAEAKWGKRFDLLWQTRAEELPSYLLLEDNVYDPGLVPAKQNHYLTTGQPVVIGHEYPDMWSDFDEKVARKEFGRCR